MDHQLPRGSLGPASRAALEAKILAAQPGNLAFTSLAAGRAWFGRAAGFGEQAERIGETRVWILPSPSPAAHRNWGANKGWWSALARAAGASASSTDL